MVPHAKPALFAFAYIVMVLRGMTEHFAILQGKPFKAVEPTDRSCIPNFDSPPFARIGTLSSCVRLPPVLVHAFPNAVAYTKILALCRFSKIQNGSRSS